MGNKKLTTQSQYEELLELKNCTGTPLVNSDQQETFQVKLIPDNSISIGMFKAHSFLVNTYLAHEQTIKAARTELFSVGESFEDLEKIIICRSCHKSFDYQFWKHCPYCEESVSQQDVPR
jgi:hypothetical protein